VNSNNKETSAPANLLKAAELLAQIGEERAFVAPEQDAGLLPMNRFVKWPPEGSQARSAFIEAAEGR
jgi:hypothetical protein